MLVELMPFGPEKNAPPSNFQEPTLWEAAMAKMSKKSKMALLTLISHGCRRLKFLMEVPPLAGMSGGGHYRAIFLSDVHLGTKGCQADRLLSFLRQHSCSQLYLVGDIIDGWRLRSKMYWPQAHKAVVRQLLAMAKNGTKLTYVTGNHDGFLRSYSDLRFGNVSVVDRAIHQAADGQRLLVVHGDQFDAVTRCHRQLAVLGDLGYRLLLRLNRHFNLLRRKFGYGYWSLSAWAKDRVKQVVNRVSGFEQAICRQCRRHAFSGVVCGHIHRPEIRLIDGVRYMNCGDWVESCTALVEDASGAFQIIDWSAAELDQETAAKPQQATA